MNYAQKNRNSAVKNLLQGNEVFANFSSTDCDGCYTQASVKVASVQHLIVLEKCFEKSLEWADGPMHMTYVFNQSETYEYYCGGSW
jgi:hypothetical protein